MFNDYFAAGIARGAGPHQRRAAEEIEVRRRRPVEGIRQPKIHAVLRSFDRRGHCAAPQCTADEVEEAIQAAAKAFPAWRDTPVSKRIQVLFRMKALLDEHLDELTHLCALENGKKWDEAQGDILKVIEVVEFAAARRTS